VAISIFSIGFKSDLLEFVGSVLIGFVGSGGNAEQDSAVNLVLIVGIAEDRNDLSLQLGVRRVRLSVFGAEDEVYDQRGCDSNEQSERRSPPGR
jgi:hypothetical protein